MSFSLDSSKRRYDGLIKIRQKGNKFRKTSTVLLFVSMIIFFGLAGIYKDLPTNLAFLPLLGIFIPMIVIAFLLNYSNRYILKRQDLRFYRFYNAFVTLQNFHDTKLSEDKKEALRSITLLSNMIGSWAPNAPPEISELPNSVSQKLKSKLLPSIENTKLDVISSFTNRLFNILFSLSETDVKIKHLEDMNNDLNSYIIDEKITTSQSKSITTKIWEWKYVLIIATSIPLFTTSQFMQEVQIGKLLESILIFALALIGVLIALYTVEKKSSRTTDNESIDTRNLQ